VLLFDTNSVPGINHQQTDLRNAVGESDCRHQHKNKRPQGNGEMRKQRRHRRSDPGLKSAITAATARRTRQDVADQTLLTALRNSTTHKDQIVLHRIGVRTETADESSKSRRTGRNSCPEE
jgi:hypothetical protein